MNEGHESHLVYRGAFWEYWVMGDFFHHLPLYIWVYSESCHCLLLQLYTNQEFWVMDYFCYLLPVKLGAITLKYPLVLLTMPVK